MAIHTFSPLFGRRLRVTQMNGDGSVGENYFVTEGFVSVSLSAEIEDGAEITLRNAQNQFCINEQLAPTFKRLTGSIQLCGVNPLLFSWMSNAEVYEDWNEDMAGYTLSEGEISGNFALELFTGLAGSLNDKNANGYALIPFLNRGTLGDIEVTGEDVVNFNIESMNTSSGNQWGTGPYKVLMKPGEEPEDDPVAAELPTELEQDTHFLFIDTAVEAPTVTTEPTAVPSS